MEINVFLPTRESWGPTKEDGSRVFYPALPSAWSLVSHDGIVVLYYYRWEWDHLIVNFAWPPHTRKWLVPKGRLCLWIFIFLKKIKKINNNNFFFKRKEEEEGGFVWNHGRSGWPTNAQMGIWYSILNCMLSCLDLVIKTCVEGLSIN
jgi:hypothetical protein